MVLVVLMNKAPFILSSSIRTISSDKLQRTISIPRMQRKLIELFEDGTEKDNKVSLFGDDSAFKESLRYMHCQSLNDERTIKFHQGWKQEDDVFDEKRQIWISKYIDPINDDMFIPRDDAQ